MRLTRTSILRDRCVPAPMIWMLTAVCPLLATRYSGDMFLLQLTRDGRTPGDGWEKAKYEATDRPRTRPEWALRVGRFVVDEEIWRAVSKNDIGEVASPARKVRRIQQVVVGSGRTSNADQTTGTDATTVVIPAGPSSAEGGKVRIHLQQPIISLMW